LDRRAGSVRRKLYGYFGGINWSGRRIQSYFRVRDAINAARDTTPGWKKRAEKAAAYFASQAATYAAAAAKNEAKQLKIMKKYLKK
jgi:hypothetical protein